MGPDAVARALHLARAFARDAALAPSDGDRLAIIVEEWVANLMEHGEQPPAGRIGLRLARDGDRVRLTFTDAGKPFDPRAAGFEGPNLERGGGAGLELVRAWSRIAAYGRRAGRNRLVLDLLLG